MNREARVDWEKEASLIIAKYVEVCRIKGTGHRDELYKLIISGLSAAFEKGREAK